MAGKVVTITSGKGGVGKTTTTANLAMGLAMRGQRVVAVDTDIGLRNLDLLMGLENRIVYDIVDVVEERCKRKQALVKDKRFPELYLLPAAQTRQKDAVSGEQIKNLCAELKEEFDFVLLDSPAGIEHGFENAIAPADEILIVTTPEMSAVRDADRIIGILESKEEDRTTRLVINRIRRNLVNRGDMMDTDDVLELLAIDLVGIVPDDEAIVVSTNRGEPAVLDPQSLAGQAFNHISRRLLGEEVPYLDLSEQPTGIFARFRGWFGGRNRVKVAS